MSRDSRLNIIVYSKTDCRSNGCLVWNCSFGMERTVIGIEMPNNEENNTTQYTNYGLQIRNYQNHFEEVGFFPLVYVFPFLVLSLECL